MEKTFGNIRIEDYTYPLPDERIARYPLAERDKSKLFVWNNGDISEDIFRNIAGFIPENSMLVFNNTRVIHARMIFRKETGSVIEIFCLEPVEPADYQVSFQKTDCVHWKCLVGNAKKWKEGKLVKILEHDGKQVRLFAEKKKRIGDAFEIEFTWDGGLSFAQIVEIAGVLPIPPYLGRETESADEETYQTLYAKIDGSVAAPTAGLHFTTGVFDSLKRKNIETSEITLHVGAGTFQPVKSAIISGHTMHHEMVIMQRDFVEKLIHYSGRIIAVGTTSVRSLESLYWLGIQLEKKEKTEGELSVSQWEPYQDEVVTDFRVVLVNILRYLDENNLKFLRFSTQIIIVPGYKFRIIDGMVTNFHQPQSTLLLLISAFLGNEWRRVYDYALVNGFRFLSYGDSNLYLK